MTDTLAELDRAENHPPDEPTGEPEAPPEPEPTPDPDPEPESPEPPAQAQRAPLSEKEVEARMQALDREAARHNKRVEEILQDDATDFRRCPACLPFAPGYRFDMTPTRDELDEIVTSLSGDERQDFAEAEDATCCGTCRGLGKVLTGSLVPEHRTKPCIACNGCGYRVARQPAPVVAAATGGELAAPIPETPAMPAPERDPWGRDRSDPNYGRMPGFEV